MVKRLFARRAEHAEVAEAALDHERLTSLVNSMADGVIAVDESMEIVVSNGSALNVLDVNNSLLGKRLGEVVHLQDRNKQPVDIEALVRKTTTPKNFRNYLLPYTDSSTINLYLSIAPVHLGYGKQGRHGYVLLLRDITREKSLEEERDEFISVVSHELRTPIAIAEGNISNAQFVSEKSGVAEQVQEALRQAHEQIIFLAGLVNDLSTLSRAERGKLTMEVTPIDVEALLKDLTASYAPTAKARHLKFKTSAPIRIGTLQSSQLYVREILQNLITNALKYTEKGSITLAAQRAGQGIRFTVTDTGIGISKADQEKIFDRFFRSEDYRTRKTNGTGLGLYVVLKLSRLLHAEVDVQSELNKGSSFSIYIPNLGLVE